jgi:hypothetical protein
MNERKSLSPFFARFLEGNVVQNLADIRGGGMDDDMLERNGDAQVVTTSNDTLKYPSDGDDLIDKPK